MIPSGSSRPVRIERHSWRGWLCGYAWLVTSLLVAFADVAAVSAQTLPPGIVGNSVKKQADGVIAILGYSAVPDGTVSSIEVRNGSTGNPSLNLLQLGAGFTVSRDFPLYLEGFLGASRYDPKFVVSNGTEERRLPTRWNSLAATGGVGWDFRLTEHWVFRPILNLSLGYITSDANIAGFVIANRTDADLKFLENGDMTAGGYGGSLMLDYELVREAYEIDAELRYTQMHLTALGGSEAVRGSSDAGALNLWTRLRVPSGFEAFGRPIRYVGELAQSAFFGDTVDALGISEMTSIGAGLELDTSGVNGLVKRARMVGRFAFGSNVTGFAIGFAVTF